MNTSQHGGFWKKARAPLLGLAILGAIATLAVAGWRLLGDLGADDDAFVYYTVIKGDLPIVVTERGSLEAQVETTIRNKVETISERSGSQGTQIIFIVPNGSSVTGPPNPDFAIKLEDETLRLFSLLSAGQPASESEELQIQLAGDEEASSASDPLLVRDHVVQALNTGRMLPELRNQFASVVAEFPEQAAVKTVEAGKEWTVSRPGDLLIELDSATIRDRIETQEVTVQKSISARIQAESRYQNQELQNLTLMAEAVLKVKLAELELKKFRDPVKGDHQLELEKIQRDIDDQNNKILEARTNLELQDNEQEAYTELFKRGYKGKGDLDRVRSAFLSAEGGLVATMNRLETLQASLDSLKEYDREMKELTLQGKVETAIRGQKQVENDNVALLQQALATKDEAIKTAEKEQDRLVRLKTQLEYCKIYAPHDGMVVYPREGRSGEIQVSEGATVRERQRLVTLPDLKLMQVKTQVHEAVLDQVHAGLPVTVRIDAYPDMVYRGTVHEVAVVPQSGGWNSSGVKTYETIIRVDDIVTNLKPGMTAVCEIHVDRVKDVLTVPVQAVVQIERDNWCYVNPGTGVERRMLQLGRSNDKFVHIREGLAASDRVVLNPMAILEEMEQAGNEISPEKGALETPAVAADSDKASQPSEPTAASKKQSGAQSEAPGKSKKRGRGGQFKKMEPEQRKKLIESTRKKRAASAES